MHIASKITLILGALLFIGSGIGLAFGVGSVADSGVETQTYFESEDGSFTIAAEPTYNLDYWTISVYVIHPIDCNNLELTITDDSGNTVLTEAWFECDTMQQYYDGDREFFSYLVASDTDESYTVDSNVEVVVEGDYCDSECIEAVVGGIFGAIGGGFGICCSIPLLILGIILALVLDEPQKNVIMPTGHMPMGQTAYQAPVGQQMIQAPVGQSIQPAAVPHTPITPPLTQQPAQPAQSPWDNVQPPQ